LNGSGTAQLVLKYGQNSAAGGATDDYFINNGAQVTLPAGAYNAVGGANFSTQKGTDAANVKDYTVITTLGANANSVTTTDLQGMNGNTSLNYALGANIDARATGTRDWSFNGRSLTGFVSTCVNLT
jgi:hypothetical protein